MVTAADMVTFQQLPNCICKDCDTIYQEDRNYCQWVLNVDTGNPAVIEFRNFIKARDEQWEEQCREQKRNELEEKEAKIEEKRRTAEVEAEAKERENNEANQTG